jgi:hypothetical protein
VPVAIERQHTAVTQRAAAHFRRIVEMIAMQGLGGSACTSPTSSTWKGSCGKCG